MAHSYSVYIDFTIVLSPVINNFSLLFSLSRSLALNTVRRCVAKKEDCFCLEVPQSMQFELAQMFM